MLALVHEGLTPPPSLEGISEEDYKSAPWKCEYDVTITLREMGHEVRVLAVYDDLRVLREAIEEFRPHIAFNHANDKGMTFTGGLAWSDFDRPVVGLSATLQR